MKLHVKIWLGNDQDHGFLGEGRYHLLSEIGRLGSLTAAACFLGISYRKAWGDIRAMEQRLGFELVHRQRGGSAGGTSKLTKTARQLLSAYGKIWAYLNTEAQRQFAQKLSKIMLKVDNLSQNPGKKL